MELEDRALVARRIHVRLEPKATAARREVAGRVHGLLARSCPLGRARRPAAASATAPALEEGARPADRAGPGTGQTGGAPSAP